MILVNWQNRWFLAQKRTTDTPSCSLTAGDWDGLDSIGFKPEQRGYIKPGTSEWVRWRTWHKHMPIMEGVTFYPKLRFKGLPVTPLWWKPDSEEPVLRVHMMPEHKYFVQSPYYTGPEATGEENWQRLYDDDWEPAGIGEWQRWLHVDELEKIEGPPPEGAF